MDHGSYFYPQLILGWEYTKTFLVLWVNGKRMKLYASDISVNHLVTYFPAQISNLANITAKLLVIIALITLSLVR